MFILTKRRFRFRAGDKEYITAGGLTMENAPDWIGATDLYSMALADGDIIEAKDSSEKAATVAVAKSEAKKKAVK